MYRKVIDLAERTASLGKVSSLVQCRDDRGAFSIAPGDRFVIDLDGTLLRAGHATRGAAAFLEAVAGRFVLVSNNSRDTSRSLSTKLKRAGFDISSDRILLAGEETMAFVGRLMPGARTLVATSAVLRHCARREGLKVVLRDADVVIVGRDTNWNYERLTHVANEVRRGAVLVATNPDLSHPGADGRIVPGTGSLVAAIEAVAGVAASHVIGKPAPALFRTALHRLGAGIEDVIVIGDNPLTDRAGADALGLRSLIVDADGRGDARDLADLHDLMALGGAIASA